MASEYQSALFDLAELCAGDRVKHLLGRRTVLEADSWPDSCRVDSSLRSSISCSAGSGTGRAAGMGWTRSGSLRRPDDIA